MGTKAKAVKTKKVASKASKRPVKAKTKGKRKKAPSKSKPKRSKKKVKKAKKRLTKKGKKSGPIRFRLVNFKLTPNEFLALKRQAKFLKGNVSRYIRLATLTPEALRALRKNGKRSAQRKAKKRK